jgi:hypothetical protein
MFSSDPRGARLRALDAKLTEFTADRGARPDGADDHGEALCDLAAAIAVSMSSWARITPRIGVERSLRFEPRLAGLLTIESVFDPLLDGPSLGVLVAAFDLAATPR